MFGWFSVLRRLSREENFIKESEGRIERLEKLSSQWEKLIEKIQECKVDLNEMDRKREVIHQTVQEDMQNLSTQIEKTRECGDLATNKVKELQKIAEDYAARMNGTLSDFDNKLASFSRQVSDLKQTVTDYLH